MGNKYARLGNRDQNHSEIVAAFNKYGVMTWTIDRPVDLLCADKQFFTVEIKYKKGKERPGQVEYRSDCKAMKLDHYVVRTVDDVINIYNERNGV